MLVTVAVAVVVEAMRESSMKRKMRLIMSKMLTVMLRRTCSVAEAQKRMGRGPISFF